MGGGGLVEGSAALALALAFTLGGEGDPGGGGEQRGGSKDGSWAAVVVVPCEGVWLRDEDTWVRVGERGGGDEAGADGEAEWAFLFIMLSP